MSGKDPGPLLDIRSGLHDKITKQLDFFVTKSFRRDKIQAQAYNKIREGVVFKDVDGNKSKNGKLSKGC